MGWFKDTFCTAPRMLPDPEPAPKPVAPPGYHFQVTDDPQLCCNVAMDDDMDEDCVLVIRLVETATGNVITEEGVYQLNRPAFWIEFAMSLCLDTFNKRREHMEKLAVIKQYVGFYPPKEL